MPVPKQLSQIVEVSFFFALLLSLGPPPERSPALQFGKEGDISNEA